ncbi:MAG: hypothetical protein JSV12_07295 [Candidatus Bathyarchaeota archaeon]|nr:MAG: hypothetical protein JSV12_07295 [Candidatus Bathyarchaeota archaeon]
MSKALTIGVAILSLITGMAGGLGTSYLIYQPQVSNLQSSQDFGSLTINATYIIHAHIGRDPDKILNITFSNPTETPIYFEPKFLVFYINQTMGWDYIEVYSDYLIMPHQTESLQIGQWKVTAYLENAEKIFLVGNNIHKEITLTIVQVPPPAKQLEIYGATFSGSSGATDNTIVLTVKNTGTMDLSVIKYKLGVGGTQHDVKDSPMSVPKEQTVSITLETGKNGEAWTSGTTYDIYLIISTGEQFPYRATAP